MEKSLEDFLTLPDVDNIQEEVFVSTRIGKVTVKAMTADEHSEYMKRAKVKATKGDIQFDSAKFNLMVVAGQTVVPDFNNAELLKKANCSTSTELIKKKLLAGEIATICEQVCRISGFDSDVKDEIEEAKN